MAEQMLAYKEKLRTRLESSDLPMAAKSSQRSRKPASATITTAREASLTH